ncbi:MAG: IclR family transcriptional regulator C-terminal domain-containing protein [Alphaproteobacteria bacterium]|nr:IclR family transcriptional regulator C-terminal domain-containing protein [Alphaproteobacteria bacterium]
MEGSLANRAKRGRRARTANGRTERSGGVQSLSRSLAVLNALSLSDHGMTLTDVAQTVGLAPSTAHRLLTTLQQDRFVRFDSERSVWLVGVQAFIVGNAFVRSRDFVAVARPFMRRLMEESGETVNLAVEDQGEAIFLAQVECRAMMRALGTPGGRVPLHCSGVGKALLSAIDEAQVAKALQRHGLQRVTDKTIDTPAKLRTELDHVRATGYAFDDEEHAVGLRCVASVIYNEHSEPLAGVSLSGPAARVTDARVPVLGALVAKVAQEITAALGGVCPARG